MSKRTKGNWQFENGKIIGNGSNIASVNASGTGEGKANGALLAAAPELYDMLVMARNVISECRKLIPKSPHDDGVPVELFIDDALAKARGE